MNDLGEEVFLDEDARKPVSGPFRHGLVLEDADERERDAGEQEEAVERRLEGGLALEAGVELEGDRGDGLHDDELEGVVDGHVHVVVPLPAVEVDDLGDDPQVGRHEVSCLERRVLACQQKAGACFL